jgi:hypothetical protein
MPHRIENVKAGKFELASLTEFVINEGEVRNTYTYLSNGFEKITSLLPVL